MLASALTVAHLTLVVQGREVRKFVLNPTVTTIGRAQDNDIVINNLALSRRHAEVHFRGGRFEVEDLGSQNGVFVNNDRIRGPQALSHEDTITLGTYHFVFTDEEQRRAAPPEPRRARRARRAQEVTQLEDPEDSSEGLYEDDYGEDEPEPSPLLVVKYNDVELQRCPVHDDEIVIGRAKDCDIQIAERRLSRRHCKIVRDGHEFLLTDLGSQNGTYVNRRRIPQYYPLRHGDLLNFAEYSVLFLADAADYDGPDRDPSDVPAPRPSSGIEKEETEFPEAFGPHTGYEEAAQPSIIPHDDDPLHPSEMTHDPELDAQAPVVVMARGERVIDDPSEPFVERPVRARERRRQQGKDVREGREIRERRREAPKTNGRVPKAGSDRPARRGPPEAAPRRRERDEREAPARRREPPPTRGERREDGPRARRAPIDGPPPRREPPRRRMEEEHRDVDDLADEVRPDDSLDDWYDAREDSEVYQEEPSVLLERSKSSMSQILSTMMVDKKDLDRNLELKANARRFDVRVTAKGDVVYEGPLESEVTILGTDAEADIQLVGRYVAGRHSLLVQVRDSLLLVRLGSSSAARVNGLPKLQAFLKEGDVVQIDETSIEIVSVS